MRDISCTIYLRDLQLSFGHDNLFDLLFDLYFIYYKGRHPMDLLNNFFESWNLTHLKKFVIQLKYNHYNNTRIVSNNFERF